jgi:CheY-like chemotaxis protein
MTGVPAHPPISPASDGGAVTLEAVPDPLPVPILVVDDDATKRFFLKRLLSPLGYTIVEADSGRAALRCLLARDFAVILLDVRMPDMDGFETAALIRTRRRSEATAIIMTTASTRDEVAASGMCADGVAIDVMFASTEPEELRATVAAFANIFRQSQELARCSRQLQLSNDRWQLIADHVPVGIFQTDILHRYTYTNPQWSVITGISAEAAVGEDLGMVGLLLTGEDTEAVGRENISHRIKIPVVGGEPKVVLLRSKPTLDHDGAMTGWVGSLTDLPRLTPATVSTPVD